LVFGRRPDERQLVGGGRAESGPRPERGEPFEAGQVKHGPLEHAPEEGPVDAPGRYHKISHEQSREIFEDAYKCLKVALTSDTFSYASERYAYKDVPVPLRPLQGPHPAFWYASSNATGSAFAGDEGLHFVTNGPSARAKANIDAYLEALAKRGGAAQPKGEFKGGAVIGVLRQVVVADTDEQARAIAAPAVAEHHANLTYLVRKHAHEGSVAQRLNIPLAATIEVALRDGAVIAGSPETVRAEIERQAG
jgi:alkanesulfonate monooxygenase SsuD/methylene tetrahydromethanopterin reductase-like flavin-dependent oxidoreductase (luciferase family)